MAAATDGGSEEIILRMLVLKGYKRRVPGLTQSCLAVEAKREIECIAEAFSV